MTTSTDDLHEHVGAREMLRHMLATLSYRAAKAVRGAPLDFAALHIGEATRTPAHILAHMADLMDWALTTARNNTAWRTAPVQVWKDDIKRLFTSITALDQFLASDAHIDAQTLKSLIQGPIADALTHTGQLTMMRRLAGAPIRGENYQRARISAGQTGFEQPTPEREFD